MNIIYFTEFSSLDEDFPDYNKYRFKDLGYIWLTYRNEGEENKRTHGFVTQDELRDIIGEFNYKSFITGKREFLIKK